MANAFLTSDFVFGATRLAAALLSKNLVAASLVSRDVEEKFRTMKTGGSVSVKYRPTLTANLDESTAGQTTLSTEDNAQESVLVDATNYVYHKQSITTSESTFSLDNFQRDVLEPAVLAVRHTIDSFFIRRISGGFARNLAGTAGTAPSTVAHIVAGRKTYVDNNGNLSARLVSILGSAAESSFLQLDHFANRDYGDDNAPALRRAKLNPLYGIEFYMDQNAGTFEQGDVAGTVLAAGGSQTGTTLNVDGFTAATGTVREGTRFTIASVSGTYTVTADTAIASNAAALPITPALASSPADNAAITFGTAPTSDVIYAPEAVAGAIVAPTPLMNGRSAAATFNNVSVRITFDSTTSGSSGAVDTMLIDAYIGCRVIRNELGLIFQG